MVRTTPRVTRPPAEGALALLGCGGERRRPNRVLTAASMMVRAGTCWDVAHQVRSVHAAIVSPAIARAARIDSTA